MALTSSNVGTTQNKTSESATAVTGITASVGDMLVVAIAANNSGVSGVSAISSVTDSAGNTYTQRTLVNNTPGGAADDGCTHALYTSKLTSALSSGSVTVNFSPNVVAKAITIRRYQPGAGESVEFRSAGSGFSGTGASASDTATSVTNADTLIYAIAIERPETVTGDSDTTNGSWGSVYQNATSGGGAATNMTVAMQEKTVTGTGDQTWNPTWSLSTEYAGNWIRIYALAAITTGFLKASDAVRRKAIPSALAAGLLGGVVNVFPPAQAPAEAPAFGWYRPLPPPKVKPPRINGGVAWSPQPIAVVDTAPSFGWYRSIPAPKVPGPARTGHIAWTPQVIAAPAQAVEFGWYRPSEPPVRQTRRVVPQQPTFVVPAFGRPFGWFGPWQASQHRRKPAQPVRATTEVFAPPETPQVTSLGWFVAYDVRPRRQRFALGWTVTPIPVSEEGFVCPHPSLTPGIGPSGSLAGGLAASGSLTGAHRASGSLANGSSAGGTLDPGITGPGTLKPEVC